jgi:DNA helicase-2/ATP-dependent DNA helicase PcrA
MKLNLKKICGITAMSACAFSLAFASAYILLGQDHSAPLTLAASAEVVPASEDVDNEYIQITDAQSGDVVEATEVTAPYDFGQKATAVDANGNRKLIDEKDFFSSCDTLRRLDEEQRKAVSSPMETNSLILAGAGSGKTRCIVSRVAYLNLVKGVPLKKIALLTFTNNTANELKKRSKELFDDVCAGLGIEAVEGCIEARTIDSFIYRLAKAHFRELGMAEEPRFSNNIGSNKDVLTLLSRIIKQENKEAIFQRYFNAEDGGLSFYLVQDLAKFFCGMEVPVPGIDTLAYSYLNYELDHSLFLDFSSLTYAFSYAAGKPGSNLKKEIVEDYDAILIDEFQDVSIIQNKVFEPLYDGSVHFSFVGDDDQTIYGWRGSDIEVINRIRHLPNTKQFNLSINYRSNISIVEAGNAILTKILGRAKSVPSKAMNDTPEKIVVSTYDEKFAQIMPEIDKLHGSGVGFEKILFLTKTNDEARGVQAALNSHDVPTVIHNDDVELDWVYWLMTSIMKIMAGYPTVAPAKTIKSILFSKQQDYTEQYIAEIVLGKNDGGEAASKLVALRQTLADKRNKTLSEAVERYQYSFSRLFNDFFHDNMFDLFRTVATNMTMPWPAEAPRLKAFIQNFENKSTEKIILTKKSHAGVKIYTIHSAKGLEADYVFILGLASGSIPNTASIESSIKALNAQILSVNSSRDKLKELKAGMTPLAVEDALNECLYAGFDDTERSWLSDFKKRVSPLKAEIGRLSSRGVSSYIDIFTADILAIENKLNQERLSVQTARSQKVDELHAYQDRDKTLGYAQTGDSPLLGQLNASIADFDKSLQENQVRLAAFQKGAHSIYDLFYKCNAAESYYSDIRKEKDAYATKSLLDKTREQLANEERRVFYVAVTRAVKKLYLLRPEGTTLSEFVTLIPERLLSYEPLLSYEEMKKIGADIDRAVETTSGKPDEEIKEEDTTIQVESDDISKNVQAFVDGFDESHGKCRLLPEKARKYFEEALRWDALGKISGNDGSEYMVALCFEKSAVALVRAKIMPGENCSISSDENDITRIYQDLGKAGLKFGAPSRSYVHDVLAGGHPNGCQPLDSIKGDGVAIFARLSGRYPSVKTPEKWKTPSCGQSKAKELAVQCIDLGKCRNAVVHKDESEWPERILGIIFDCYLAIVDLIL